MSSETVLICGGAGLLGKSFSLHLAETYNLVIADYNLEAATQLCKELTQRNPTKVFTPIHIDITNELSVKTVLKYLEDEKILISSLVNNAYPRNKNYGKHFFDVKYSDFCENLNANIGGYFLMCQQFSGYFKSKGSGNIVNISSIYGHFTPDFSVYNDTKMTMPVEYTAIKAAVNNLTRYLAKYLAGTGIRVNALSPGGIFDDQDPKFVVAYNAKCLSKGMLSPNDLCGTLSFLLSRDSQYINGQNIVVDDGFTL